MLDHMADEERPAKRNATYQDVIDAPEHMVAEILDGDLFLSPRPAPRHARATLRIGGLLDLIFDEEFGERGGWTIFVEPEIHLKTDVVVPDLAGWRGDRLAGLSEHAAFISQAPDWACEVLSPSTERIDRGRKLRIYARERVSYLWLVSSIRRTLEVYERKRTAWSEPQIFRDDEIVRVAPFEAIDIPLSRLWLKFKKSSRR